MAAAAGGGDAAAASIHRWGRRPNAMKNGRREASAGPGPEKKGWMVHPAPRIQLAASSAPSSPGSPAALVLPALSGHITLPCHQQRFAHPNNNMGGISQLPQPHTFSVRLLKSFPIIFLRFQHLLKAAISLRGLIHPCLPKEGAQCLLQGCHKQSSSGMGKMT